MRLYHIFSEEQRHTGAGGFVWSSAVENDFAVARLTVTLLLQLLESMRKRREWIRVGLEVHRVAQVNDDQFFAGVDSFLQFVTVMREMRSSRESGWRRQTY